MTSERDLSVLLDRWNVDSDPGLAPGLLAAARSELQRSSDSPSLWRHFLEATGEQRFLQALPDEPARQAWAEVVFAALRVARFGLGELFDWRVRTRPDVVYLHDLGRAGEPTLTFAQTLPRLRRLAAHLLGPEPLERPRACVGLLTANTLDGALCDLACLTHDIPVAPLNIQEDVATLAWICDRLLIADLIVDTPDRLERALEIRDRVARPFTIHLLAGSVSEEDRVRLLAQEIATLDGAEVERRLAARPRLGLDDTCTLLFTSGSTGRPKGIAFSPFHLVSKRFARHAALPMVGQDELLVCYLPLYHTFGRYLELLGMMYWGGTYAFAASPSGDALLDGMSRLRPTGLISVPLRWHQIRERVLAGDGATLRDVTGGRLRWGLSAAGWLAPDTFRWFHGQGVALCSGFGMTEGTGGLTMTPPDEYREDSVGRPLPGVRVRLGAGGELQVAGPYVAPYLPPEGVAGDLTPAPLGEDGWLGTGDLFETLDGGHLRIVDRIKDIYKNNRGQTVAPRKVESRFAAVPGIASTFLAGDGRPYNVLLIVPDLDDPVLAESDAAEREVYFQRIVSQANLDLAAYERVVNFAVLERPFSAERGELTPKGSFRRKTIAGNFAELLDQLYRRRALHWGDLELLLPDWVLRELGSLEDEIDVDGDALFDQRRDLRLELGHGRRPGSLRLGDLEYLPRDTSRGIDLGVFARQPLLWVGNPALQRFLPCRSGWDVRFAAIDEQVQLPPRDAAGGVSQLPGGRQNRLGQLDDLISTALFGPTDRAVAAVGELEPRLHRAPPREALLMRRRLEALSGHPDLEVRAAAYRVLVLDDPEPDYGSYLPAFVTSGQPFLTAESMAAIAAGVCEPRRLLSFRRRLRAYRQQLEWPAAPSVRGIFVDLLRLLSDFARRHPENFAAVRRELICWQLFDRDPELAEHAAGLRHDLVSWHRERLAEQFAGVDRSGQLVFQAGLRDDEIARLREVLGDPTFLAESVVLAFDARLDADSLTAGSVWVSRTAAGPAPSRYRVSITTRSGRHFDLLVILRGDIQTDAVAATFDLAAAIRSWHDGMPVLPRLGALRDDLHAVSVAFADGLTVWDRIRRHAGSTADVAEYGPARWRRLLIAGMATVLTVWRHSDRRVVPGMITPSNVLVPQRDWLQGRQMLSLAGWQPYQGPLDLLRPLLRNFLRLPERHYPALRLQFDDRWLAEAVTEALGAREAAEFLDLAAAAVQADPPADVAADFASELRRFAVDLRERHHPNLTEEAAALRFQEWRAANAGASPRAQCDQLEALLRFYRFDREGELAMLALLRETVLTEAGAAAREACDRLLARLFRHPGLRAMRCVELGDLQAALDDPAWREVLARLVFPPLAGDAHPALQTVGDRAREHVVLQTECRDDHGADYRIREPRDAAEMGRLYREFLRAKFPLRLSELDRHLVLVDADGQLAGGVVWRLDTAGEPHLDGVVVSASLGGRGLARALLDDFARRLSAAGHTVLRTHYSLREFFAGLGFAVDEQRGGLVRRL